MNDWIFSNFLSCLLKDHPNFRFSFWWLSCPSLFFEIIQDVCANNKILPEINKIVLRENCLKKNFFLSTRSFFQLVNFRTRLFFFSSPKKNLEFVKDQNKRKKHYLKIFSNISLWLKWRDLWQKGSRFLMKGIKSLKKVKYFLKKR